MGNYTQTTANLPESVLMGEAVGSELSKALHLTVKIEPENGTEYGEMVADGVVPNVKPGYVIGYGQANWDAPSDLTLGTMQLVDTLDSGDVGSQAFRTYASVWFDTPNDPRDIALWGNPTDVKLGVTFSSWAPLIASAKKDILYLNAWTARQPLAYREALNPPGTVPLNKELADYEAGWKTAKTATQKHTAWVDLWHWVGTYSTGDDSASIGLNALVYTDQHEPALQAKMRMLEAEVSDTPGSVQSTKIAAEIANTMIQSAYEIPLNVQQSVYLEKPDLTGVQTNPWGWGYFYQMQYLQWK